MLTSSLPPGSHVAPSNVSIRVPCHQAKMPSYHHPLALCDEKWPYALMVVTHLRTWAMRGVGTSKNEISTPKSIMGLHLYRATLKKEI